MLVDYVFGRPAGEPVQETGGVLVTLAALGNANDIRTEGAGAMELKRCWENIQKIRAKQAGKPRHSPLPGPTPETKGTGLYAAVERAVEKADAALADSIRSHGKGERS